MKNFNRNNDSREGRRSGFGRNDRQMFNVVCNKCGKDCKVPFKPTGNRPVYCNDCFGMKENRGDRRFIEKPRFAEKNQCDQCKNEFEKINVKLDRILDIFNSKFSLKSSKPAPNKIEKPTIETEDKLQQE